MHRDRARGFTLVEVLVALALGALVVLVAHRGLTAVLDGRDLVLRGRHALDCEVNAQRLLASLFSNLHLDATDRTGGFRGVTVNRRPSLSFSSWVEAVDGGWEVRRVRLGVSDGLLLVETEAASRVPDTIVAARGLEGVTVEYLLDIEPGAAWLPEWISITTMPVAIRLSLRWRDGTERTTRYLVGERG